MTKAIYDDTKKEIVTNITPYLNQGNSTIIYSSNTSISNLPTMEYGNMPLEGGYLKLNELEKNSIINEFPKAKKFIKPVIGGEELINSIPRFCLWIDDKDLEEAKSIPPILDRINKVKQFRETGGEVARTLVNKSHQFRYRKVAMVNQIVIPCTSSEKRDYLQCGLFDSSYITMNSLEVIYDAPIWVFGILSSKMHMAWVKAVGGRLETRYRYSAQLCYNTFPFPHISEEKKKQIEETAENVLVTRAFYPEKTLAELYDPDKMPEDLKEAHAVLDDIVESCYPGCPFANDEARLECLFKLYEKMTNKK